MIAVAFVSALCIWGNWLFNTLHELWAIYGSPQAIRGFIAGYGPWAPLIFLGLQVVQIVVAPVPGEVTGLLSGYLFGTWFGLLYSTIGLTLGSSLAFGLSRWLGLWIVHRVVPPRIYGKLSMLVRPQAVAVTFILFLIPGFPKDYLTYFLGLTPMSWGKFLLVSTVGRIPGTWLLAAQGGAAGSNSYGLLLVLILTAGALALLCYFYRRKILQWVHRLSDPSPSNSPGPDE